MEQPDSTKGRLEEKENAPEQETPDGSVSLFVRLWTYGGPWQPLSAVALDKDPELAQLINNLVTEGRGKIAEQTAEMLVARFHAPFYALSAAKSLQQRLLTFQRKQPPQQIVPSILVSGGKSEAPPTENGSRTEIAAASNLLAGGNTAQILVSEGIYEIARNAPGFQFNPKPVREAGESGEAIYELLWTDESTYGHLRDAGRSSTGITTAGRYQILAELGRGAMGVVYKAFDQLIGRTVALKTISINRNAPNREELIERLKQEAKAAGGLDHPNIITIYDVGQEDDLVYLSMQFVEGKTLLNVMTEGALPPLPALVSYAEQICSAVGFAHKRGVIHRDLKPANLMLTSEGIIKVLDFGIAKIEDATLTQTGLVVGTPTHMAPEQASGKKIDQRADIFALGSVFYELFTREKPFKGDVTTVLYQIMHEDPKAPSLINPALPGGIDAIIRKALAKDPNDRFQTCEEMGKAFSEQAALLKTAPNAATAPAAATVAMPAVRSVVAAVPSPRREAVPQQKRRGLVPGIAAILVLAAGGVAIWAGYVKTQTGSLPPLIQKFATAWQRVKPHRASSGVTPSTGQTPSIQTDQNSNASGSSTAAGNTPASGSNTSTSDSAPAQTSPDNTGSAPPSQTPVVNPSSGASPPSGNSQPAAGSVSPSTATVPANVATQGSDNPAKDSVPGSSASNDQSVTTSGTQAGKKPAKTAAPTVDGFSRRDVPELVRQADAAAGRGDYRLARYEYSLILKLEPGNAAARAGLRRVQAAQQDGSPR